MGIKVFGAHLWTLRQALADEADITKPTVQRTEQAKFAATLDVLLSLGCSTFPFRN